MRPLVRDSTFWGLPALGAGMLALAGVFYRMDTAFVDQATETTAVVIDKHVRSRAGSSSDTRSIRYEWRDSSVQPTMTWSGTASYSGGEEAFDALVPGESTVRIAWRRSQDGRSVESRLLVEGFTGIPWPFVIIGFGLLAAAPIRFAWIARAADSG